MTHNKEDAMLKEFDVYHVIDACIDWIKDYFANTNGSTAIVGISGGKDSTVTAALLSKALGKDSVIGVLMPNGVQKDIEYSHKVCKELGIESCVLNVNPMYDYLLKEIKSFNEIAARFVSNTPARLRMVTLYAIASNIKGSRVANTCNLSESIVGWETYGGDGFGDFSPLGLLTKTEVCEIGHALNLSSDLVDKIPDDGMCGFSDEDKFGFTYEELDMTIRHEDYCATNFEKICRMNKNSHFKHEQLKLPVFDPHLLINPVFNW